MTSENPGNVRWQLGQSLNAIRDAIEAEDPLKLGNHLHLVLTITAPYTTPEQRREWRPRDGDMDEDEFVTKCLENLADLLVHLSERNIYAYTESEIGDAGELALGVDA